MDEQTYTHMYRCFNCGALITIEHPDDFSYMDDCPQCGSDDLDSLDIVPTGTLAGERADD